LKFGRRPRRPARPERQERARALLAECISRQGGMQLLFLGDGRAGLAAVGRFRGACLMLARPSPGPHASSAARPQPRGGVCA
jgi:hypothetical protein